MAHDADWHHLRGVYRREVFRVIAEIRDGRVDINDLGKLGNFCAVALMLMAKVPAGAWRAAEKEAEIAAYIWNEVAREDQGDPPETPI